LVRWHILGDLLVATGAAVQEGGGIAIPSSATKPLQQQLLQRGELPESFQKMLLRSLPPLPVLP